MEPTNNLEPAANTGPDVNFGIYFGCPECRIHFNAWQGFVIHMIVEHFWERDMADMYWKQLVMSRFAAA